MVGRSQLTPYSNWPHSVSVAPILTQPTVTYTHDSKLTQRAIRKLQFRVAPQFDIQGYNNGFILLIHKHRMPL